MVQRKEKKLLPLHQHPPLYMSHTYPNFLQSFQQKQKLLTSLLLMSSSPKKIILSFTVLRFEISTTKKLRHFLCFLLLFDAHMTLSGRRAVPFKILTKR